MTSLRNTHGKKRLGTFSLKWYFTSVKILYSGKVQNLKKNQPNAFITCISSGGKIPQVIFLMEVYKIYFFSIYYIAPFSITNNYCRWNMLPVGWYELKKSGCKLSRQWLMLLFRKLLLIQVKKCFLNWHWHNRPFPCSIENTSKKLHWTRLNDAIFFTLNVVCTLDLLNNVFFIRMSASNCPFPT